MAVMVTIFYNILWLYPPIAGETIQFIVGGYFTSLLKFAKLHLVGLSESPKVSLGFKII